MAGLGRLPGLPQMAVATRTYGMTRVAGPSRLAGPNRLPGPSRLAERNRTAVPHGMVGPNRMTAHCRQPGPVDRCRQHPAATGCNGTKMSTWPDGSCRLAPTRIAATVTGRAAMTIAAVTMNVRGQRRATGPGLATPTRRAVMTPTRLGVVRVTRRAVMTVTRQGVMTAIRQGVMTAIRATVITVTRLVVTRVSTATVALTGHLRRTLAIRRSLTAGSRRTRQHPTRTTTATGIGLRMIAVSPTTAPLMTAELLTAELLTAALLTAALMTGRPAAPMPTIGLPRAPLDREPVHERGQNPGQSARLPRRSRRLRSQRTPFLRLIRSPCARSTSQLTATRTTS